MTLKEDCYHLVFLVLCFKVTNVMFCIRVMFNSVVLVHYLPANGSSALLIDISARNYTACGLSQYLPTDCFSKREDV